MLIASEVFDAESAGTTVGDVLEVRAWRGGDLLGVSKDRESGLLGLSAWSLSWDASRQVQGQATLTVVDPDGDLAPWGMGDALAPGGSRLSLVWASGGSSTRVPLDWWRVRAASPREQWRVHRTGQLSPAGAFPGSAFPGESAPVAGLPGVAGALAWVPGSGSVQVRVDDMTSAAVLARLDGEGNPPAGATCLSEVRRLLDGLMAVEVAPGVVDRPVPGDLVYGDGRMDAVQSLVAHLDAGYRTGPSGSLQVVPLSEQDPVWTIEGGEGGVLVDVARDLTDDGVYNAVVSRSTLPDGTPITSRAYLEAGPLAWGGPFGRVPAFHQSIATSQAGLDADAASMLATLSSSGRTVLAVDCLTHPGVQVHDWVTVVAPTVAGGAPLVGRVVSKRMSSATVGKACVPSKRMSLGVQVSIDALEAVSRRVSDA